MMPLCLSLIATTFFIDIESLLVVTSTETAVALVFTSNRRELPMAKSLRRRVSPIPAGVILSEPSTFTLRHAANGLAHEGRVMSQPSRKDALNSVR